MIQYAIIAGLTFLMYVRILPYDYIIDDQLVPKGKGRHWLETFWLQLTARKYSNRYTEHAQRICVHAIVGCLIYGVFGPGEMAFMAALMFAVNPANNNGVAWLNGIGYAVSAACVLLMVQDPVIGGICYLWTLWWHVTAFPAPLLFLFTGQPVWALWILVYGAIVFVAKGKVPFGKVQDNATLSHRWGVEGKAFKKIWLGKFIFVIKTYAYYHWLTILPVRIGLYHTFGYAFALTKKDTIHWSLASPLFLLGILTIGGHVWLIREFWGTPLAFGLIWFDLFIAQWCNLVLIHQTITERYCYIPCIGLMLALSWAIHFYLPLDVARIVTYSIVTAYSVKLFYYLPGYKNMESFTRMNLQEFPDQFGAWNWAGTLQREKGRIFSAMYHWAIGLRFNPTSFRLNFNMAQAFKTLGYLDQAKLYLDRAEQGLPPEVLEKHKAVIEEEKIILNQLAGRGKIIVPKRMIVPDDWKKGDDDARKNMGKDPETKGKGIVYP